MDRVTPPPTWTVDTGALGTPPAWLMPAGAVALAAFIVLAFANAIFGCGDTSWHLAAGDWTLAHQAVPHTDPFSFTFAGRPWVAHEWLAELLMAAMFTAASWNGLALMFAAAFAATLLVIGGSLGRRLPSMAVLVMLALIAAALMPGALARPHLLGWLMLAVWLAMLLRARDADRAPPLAGALLMLVWANLHASFLFGLGLAAAMAVEALLARASWPVLLSWAAFGILALLASLATPHGVAGLLFPIQLSGMRTLPLISEWLPTSFTEQPGIAFLLLAGAYVFATRPVRVPPIRALIIVVTLIMALAHARHQTIFAIVAPMLLAGPIAEALPTGEDRDGRHVWSLIAAMLALAAVATVVRLALPAAERDSITNPVTMLDGLPPALLARPVLNDYAFGGPLIRRGIRPFIDGRADMYGDDFVELYARLDGGDIARFRMEAKRYGISWTILSPASQLAAKLDHEPGWRRLRADKWAVVHVRSR